MTSASTDPLALAFQDELTHAGVAGRVVGWDRLTGGASRETYRAVLAGPDGGAGQTLIVQRERPGSMRRPEGMAAEAAVVRAAGAEGMAVPEVVLANGPEARTALGASFFATRAVAGETLARKLLRDEPYAAARAALPAQLGEALARLHRIDPSTVPHVVESDELANYRQVADDLDLVSPAFEVAFRWLEANRPASEATAVVHGDFRLGNLIVDRDGLAAVIDWELAHVGDPMEDLGWLCVRAWRFGGPKPVAGMGSYTELFEAYERAGGGGVDPEVVRWWEVLGSLKWGIMCGIQASSHRSGAYRSVELLAIGRRIPEQEQDVLRLIDEIESGVSLV